MPICVCPHCQARYNIPAAKLGASGRNVKCAKCGNQFFAAPEAPVEAATEPTPQPTATETTSPAPTIAETPPEAPASTENTEKPASTTLPTTPDLSQLTTLKHQPKWFRSLMGSPFIWLGLATLAFTGLALYSVLGMLEKPEEVTVNMEESTVPEDSVTPPNLALSDLERNLTQRGNTWVLTISGMVTNNGTKDMQVPEIRVQLLDPNNIALDFWPAEVSARTLGPGQSSPWQARFLNPPVARLASFRAYFRDPEGKLAAQLAEEAAKQKPVDGGGGHH